MHLINMFAHKILSHSKFILNGVSTPAALAKSKSPKVVILVHNPRAPLSMR